MKTHILFSILLCVLVLLSCSDKTNIEEKMQLVLDKSIEKYNVRGTSAAVIFSDNSLWTGVSGVSHDTVSIKPDMLFAVGSITKNIVAALTLQVVEENILSLEELMLLALESGHSLSDPTPPILHNCLMLGQIGYATPVPDRLM